MRLSGTQARSISSSRGLGNTLWDLAGNRPSLDLRFAESKSLVDATTGTNLVDFTRASSGTYVGSDGLIKTATTNLLLRSEKFDQSPWSKGANTTITPSYAAAPNGTLTAYRLQMAAGVGTFLTQATTLTNGLTYTLSVYARATTGTGQITLAQTGTNIQTFPLTTAWQRVSVTFIASSSTSVGFDNSDIAIDVLIWGAQLEQSSTVGEYVKTTSTINSAPRFDHDPITGESLGLLVEEQRTNLVTNSSAIGAATGTPGTLPTNWGNIGGATGLTSQISGIGTENGIPYVDFRFFGTTGSNFLTIVPASGAIGYITNTAYTASIYTKLVAGGIPAGLAATLRIRYNLSPSGSTDISTNFSISNTGRLISNRFFSTGTTTGTLTGTGLMFLQLNYTPGQVVDFTIRVGYPQLEQGNFATSAIPTTTSAVTRAADVASISGSNFSSWYNASEGTVYAESRIERQNTVGGAAMCGIETGVNNTEAIYMHYRVAGTTAFTMFDNSVLQVDQTPYPTAVPANTPVRQVGAFKLNDSASAANGSAAVTDTTCTIPTPDQMLIGFSTAGSAYLNGTLRRLTFWPSRLPNSTLRTLTL